MSVPANPLFRIGDAYKELHRVATQIKPVVSLGDGEFAVGILQHNLPLSPENLLWFKVKARHNVQKLRKAYLLRAKVEVQFQFANMPIGDQTTMSQLNITNDNIVLFTAHTESSNTFKMSPVPSSSASIRSPLRLSNSQLSSKSATSNASQGKLRIKADLDENISPQRQVQADATASDLVNRSKEEFRRPSFSDNSIQPKVEQIGGSLQQSFSEYVSPYAGLSLNVGDAIKNECDDSENSNPMAPPTSKQTPKNERLLKTISDGTPEILEAEVKSSRKFLENLKAPMANLVDQHKDAKHWVQQIDTLLKQEVDTPTIIGVVGNTGAGKSSVINAMLEEERLVPTNCMRACTAVVTEMSWNSSKLTHEKYRADIEFISAAEWQKDLELSLNELIDANGQVSRDCTNPESEAGIAYAKVKAVYPQKTKDQLAVCSVDDLIREPGVKAILGSTKKIAAGNAENFYRSLQHYVDSKEKVTEKKKKGERVEKKQMEFWPLIRRVRIYTKADALSTGAIIVDLPGVHDSNAARAAVAAGYMKQCTGLFIVAPINRAVDDKSAKNLMGESFKRQMKFDGTYSRITFICSKTDDISVIEAADSLGIDTGDDWDKVDALERQQRKVKEDIENIKEARAVFLEVMNDADDKLEAWEKLKEQLEDGEQVWAPTEASKKRKRSEKAEQSRKKSKKSTSDSDNEDDFVDNEDEEDSDARSEDEDAANETEKGDPLTRDEIEEKVTQFKEDKKRARRERTEADAKLIPLNQEMKTLKKEAAEIEAKMRAACIAGRNEYSKTAIQRDFADGIKELDMESAQEEDPDQFNPEEDIRDYDEVARLLPVFCVSSRAYQKLSGRFIREKDVAGYQTGEETEIPQLQAHCKKLTENGRASNCRNYLNALCTLLNSICLWTQNDGIRLNLTDTQRETETQFLKTTLSLLENNLENAVKCCLKEMNDALAENIFEHYEQYIGRAITEAEQTVSKWHAPVNRENRPLGGYYWATYKAITRREGVFSNVNGTHDFNAQLIEPIIKQLAGNWERVFAQRLPRVLQAFTRQSKGFLATFHGEIEQKCIQVGTGAAGIGLLKQQLKNYENAFQVLTTQMTDMINELQREANREFTPAIARNLATAYNWCASETGPGQYKRMKTHMEDHISRQKAEMLSESCDEVKTLLLSMCEKVETVMTARAEEVLISMQRDYMAVISGTSLLREDGMPIWERKMRVGVEKVIEERDATAVEDHEKAAAEMIRMRRSQDQAKDDLEGNFSSAESDPDAMRYNDS